MTRLTRSQVRDVDRRSIQDYHVPGIVLMENAARAVADQACLMLDGQCAGEVLILCGGGNNGGDGLAVARHLHNRGANVTIALTVDPALYAGDALINWQVVSAMGLDITDATPALLERSRALLIVDAIFGTGLTHPPRDPFPALAAAVEKSDKPVLAVDVPSGLDCDTGVPPGACIAADRTVTFVAEKVGFAADAAKRYLGHVVVADIGCPREVIAQVLKST
ncbi:MAG TPA: NAD(P)H-hydrate epimerase [Tepidisphaeraceae bacterium]|nr:NAD(P)H-hydrate epimerase [Tepidisphaeraceae bacterium]